MNRLYIKLVRFLFGEEVRQSTICKAKREMTIDDAYQMWLFTPKRLPPLRCKFGEYVDYLKRREHVRII